jgi:hypothetical protein
MLFQIKASYFCAGGEIADNRVIDSAPIIQYMKGWSYKQVYEYCQRKKWEFRMIPDIKKAEYLEDYKIRFLFDNGKSGIVDFTKYIKRGGVFKKLENIEFFKNFSIDSEIFVIKWGDKIDIAPEEIYSEATGEPLPSWME